MLEETLTNNILKCAVLVHRALGPGLNEYSYHAAFALELDAQKLQFSREPTFAVRYRGVLVGWHRPDFVVESKVIVELKAAASMPPVFTKQVLTYLRVTGLHVGLLLNFNVPSMNHGGIRRFVL
jgi:GxxExxY protein